MSVRVDLYFVLTKFKFVSKIERHKTKKHFEINQSAFFIVKVLNYFSNLTLTAVGPF